MESVFDKPLIMKDFLPKERKTKSRKSKLYEKVKKVPESKSHRRQSKYSELVNAIAKEKKGTYKVLLSSIKTGLSAKSAYPSVEKALVEVARRNGVDFSTTLKRPVETKNGVKTHVSYPEYAAWKAENMSLRIVNNELFIVKKTDRPL